MRAIEFSLARADERRASRNLAHADMEIGDLVTYEGRTYVLRGFEPMSVDDRRADLEDPRTGERIRAPIDEVEPRDV